MKTSETYKNEILEKYQREKGGDMSGYLAKPTRKQIREACIWLLNKRNNRNDEKTLNRFFKFEEGKSKILTIEQTKGDIYKPIINFLKGGTNSTSIENLELISWLIDFKPRPYFIYSRSEVHPKEPVKEEVEIKEPTSPISSVKKGNEYKEGEKDSVPKDKEDSNTTLIDSQPPITKSPKKYYIKITIGVVLSIFLVVFINLQMNQGDNTTNKCMAWVETSYEEMSCDMEFHPNSGTKAEPYDPKRFKSFKKVEVTILTKFFSEETKKPLLWYYKKSNDEIEYYTAAGRHPINGETLKKITPYIIDTYVPKHTLKPDSFIDTGSENKE